MLLERSLALQQKQSLTVSKTLIQSLKILQFRHDELTAFIAEQAERNPLIDVVPPLVPAGDVEKADASVPPPPANGAPASDPAPGLTRKPPPIPDAPFNRGAGDSSSDDRAALACAARMTLREHLHGQIALTLRDPDERALAHKLVECLDPDGYLRTRLESLAGLLGADAARLARALAALQRLDPAGVGARSLAECLRLQLSMQDRLSPELSLVLDNLGLLAKCDYARLATLTRTTPETVAEMARQIRRLDPRPGLRFDAEPVIPALPDVIVTHASAGRIALELNDTLLPRVLVNRQYYAEITTRPLGESDKRYVVDCMNRAAFLVKSLEQRARTLLRIATEIAGRQADFLQHGPRRLRPLSLREVAEATGFHESTVSRAVANKHMMTAHGMVALKYFFSNPIAGTQEGADHSAETVRQRIRRLVDGECAAAILSDDEIVARLRADGIVLARRTVAKYRDQLRIPSSLQRRRSKRIVGDCADA